KPHPVAAKVTTEYEQPILKLAVNASQRRGEWTPLIPDHGKMMHLFLIGDGMPRAFAHLHPVARSKTAFEVPLPPLPPGLYHVYADVTHENGFSETLIASTAIPASPFALQRLWMGNSSEAIC